MLFRLPALAGALGIFLLIAIELKRGVEIPYWDEWEWADLIFAAHTHALTFGALWTPHNEHRIVIPSLLMLGLDALGGWDVVREQLVSLAMLALTQLAIWALILRTVPAARAGWSFLVASAVLLGLAQYENLEWGFQMAWFLCDLGLVVAVWALTRPHRHARDVVVAVLAAVVASLSSSQGLVVWPAGLVAILLVPRRAVLTAVAWLIVGVPVIAAVRSGSPGSGGPGHVGLTHVGLLAHYVAIYLGAPLAASGGIDQATVAGTIVLLWLALIAVVAARRSLTVRVRLAPWLAIASYPVLCAAVTASARAGFGLGQAASSRYTSIGALAWIAAVAATFIVIPRGRGWVVAAAPALAVFLASLGQSRFGNDLWHQHTTEMRTARAEIVAGDRAGLKLVYPETLRVTTLLRKMAEVRDGIFSGS